MFLRKFLKDSYMQASLLWGAIILFCLDLCIVITIQVGYLLPVIVVCTFDWVFISAVLGGSYSSSKKNRQAKLRERELLQQVDNILKSKQEMQALYITMYDQQTQKLKALGSLASGVAHDINNVLAVILCMVEAQPSLSDKVSEAISSACMRGKGVVQSLMYFSKGSLDVVEKVDLNQIVISALKNLTDKPTTLLTELLDVPYIDGDPHALEHAITHLILNSIDSFPAENPGLITIKTSHLEGVVSVSVLDTGSGMSPEVLEKATEPFFSTKSEGRCSGLGLASVKSTVNAHSGVIHISSKQGEGTSVTLSFPVPEVVNTSRSEIASDALQIMIVDDDELFRMSFSALLEMMGHTVIPISSGYEAIKQFETGVRPSILILDMYMPGINADLTIPRILRLCPSQRILLATGAQTDAIDSILRAYPQVTKVSKPFSARELSVHVSNLCRGLNA